MYEDEDVIEDMYKKVYMKMIYAKMCFNNISYASTNLYHIPKCMSMTSFKRLKDRVKRDNTKDDKLLWDSDWDMSEKELNTFLKKHCPVYQHAYDYSVDFSKQEDEEEQKYIKELREKIKKSKISDVEQAVNVTPMFKVMKKKVNMEKK